MTEGVPNTYALNFVVLVPATVNALHFTWKTLGQKPVRTNLYSCFFPSIPIIFHFYASHFKKGKVHEVGFSFLSFSFLLQPN